MHRLPRVQFNLAKSRLLNLLLGFAAIIGTACSASGGAEEANLGQGAGTATSTSTGANTPVGMDAAGNLVDAQGNVVDPQGNLLDESGNPVDAQGNPIATNGMATTASGTPDNLPGVVLDGVCYALCQATSVGTAEDPDWGFENDASCVIPASPTAAAQSCTTGQPLPPPEDIGPLPGVVLSGTCYPLCQSVTMPSDPDEPDWGYENSTSCVLPETKTSVAQLCTTGEALPDPAELDPRPGVVTLNPETQERECSPLCTWAIDPSLDPQGDDWDYEYSGSCVIPSSTTSQNQPCQTGETVPAPLAKPGVVVIDGAGVAGCSPLCVVNSDPALDPEQDGWAYEDNSSCVIPGTAAAETNLACITGEAIPEDTVSRSGFVVKLVDESLECVAACTFYTTPVQDGANDDGFADDWGWENNAACIIPETTTAIANLPCMTLDETLPVREPTPGIYINGDPEEDSCQWSACVPLCTVVTQSADPEYPDWGWEFNESCVLAGTDTADIIGGDEAKSIENHGYAVPPRGCMFGEALPDTLTPPALAGTFTTSGASLLDPNGTPFVVRGVNNSHAWYDICGQYSAYEALDNIEATGANTVRVGWAFDSINPGGPTDDAMADADHQEKVVIGTTPGLLSEILYRVVELGMVPMLAINDSTGQLDTTWPLKLAQRMMDAEYRPVIEAYESYLLLGIANEWNGGGLLSGNVNSPDFRNAYEPAIAYLREQGIGSTLVITANDWGQGCQAILNDAQYLIDQDPLHNLIFDIHIYTYITYAMSGADNPDAGGEAARVQGCMTDIANANIPLVVGEFGNTHSSGAVAWETIISQANTHNQGYVPWLWYGDTEYPDLNMNDSWEGPLLGWGNDVVPLGGTKASMF